MSILRFLTATIILLGFIAAMMPVLGIPMPEPKAWIPAGVCFGVSFVLAMLIAIAEDEAEAKKQKPK